MRKRLLVPAGCLVALAVACGGDDDEPDPPASLPTVATAENGSRADFINQVEDQLTRLDAEIAVLEREAANAGEAADAQLRTLKDQWADLQVKLTELEAADDSEWEQVRSEIEEQMNEAESLADEIASNLGL